tara:strand:- start:283 stop:396 length:114 start_codon:yes stop_codon:yes gene_type:complete
MKKEKNNRDNVFIVGILNFVLKIGKKFKKGFFEVLED